MTATSQQHRAGPWQWETIERMRHHAEFSCLLELRDRIKALERDRRTIFDSSSRLRLGLHDSPAKPNHPAKPDSSLVKRLALTLAGPNDDAELWMLDARAAIREVAAWMTSNPDHHFPPTLVFALEQEAEQ